MYPRRTLIPVPDSRVKRKAARNNKYLYSLRLKNIRSAVKKKLKNAKIKVRKPLLKKCRIADKKPFKRESESQSGSNSLIIPEEVKNVEKESPKPLQLTEESYAGNKHTRSFSKRCNELASIYIPCDYSYELKVRKTWPADSSSNEISAQELHQSDQLQYSIREVLKDSLDLVLGYCFSYVPEEIQTDNAEQLSVNDESIRGYEKSKNESATDKIEYCSENLTKHVEKTESNLFTCIKSIDLTELNYQADQYLCKNESKCCFLDSKNVLDYSVVQSEADNNFEFPNLPEKCDDLNISEFLRPHLSPGGTKRQSIENTKLVSKNLKQNQLLIQNLTKVSGNAQAVLAVNKDHSYAKLDRQTTFRENLLQNLDLNCTLFVNKESSPKQYRNIKRGFISNDKEGTFRFGTRSKIKKVSDSKKTKTNDNMSSYCKQITKNNCFSKVQNSTITSYDNQTNIEVNDNMSSYCKQISKNNQNCFSKLQTSTITSYDNQTNKEVNDNMSSYCKQISKNNQNCFSKLQTSTITSYDKQTNKEVIDNMSSYCKQITKNNQNCFSKLQTSTITSYDKQTNKEVIDNMSSYCKQITKNNQNGFSKLQTSTITSYDNQTNKEIDDRLFLKELVMDTAMLYSMLCSVEPEDIAFYINSRPMDPDQWALDILDSI